MYGNREFGGEPGSYNITLKNFLGDEPQLFSKKKNCSGRSSSRLFFSNVSPCSTPSSGTFSAAVREGNVIETNKMWRNRIYLEK